MRCVLFLFRIGNNFWTKFGIKTLNMDKKKEDCGQSIIRLMIKLRSKLLRLATVARVKIAKWANLTSSHIINGPTHF